MSDLHKSSTGSLPTDPASPASDRDDVENSDNEEDLTMTILDSCKQNDKSKKPRRKVITAMEEPKHPASGVQHDLERFLRAWLHQGTARYSVFCELWRQHNLSFLYYGRQSLEQLLDFVECLFYQLVAYSQPPNSLLVRIGSLYLMYAFYSQISRFVFVRFRVTPQQWSKLTDLEEILVREQHVDAVYCFRSLVTSKAFYFCVTVQPFYPGVPPLECASDIPGMLLQNDILSFRDVIGHDKLETLKAIHCQYQNMKSSLKDINKDPTLSILDDCSLARLETSVEQAEKFRSEFLQPESDQLNMEDSSHNTIASTSVTVIKNEPESLEVVERPEEGLSIGEKRTQLKAMAMASSEAVSRKSGRRSKETPTRSQDSNIKRSKVD